MRMKDGAHQMARAKKKMAVISLKKAAKANKAVNAAAVRDALKTLNNLEENGILVQKSYTLSQPMNSGRSDVRIAEPETIAESVDAYIPQRG